MYGCIALREILFFCDFSFVLYYCQTDAVPNLGSFSFLFVEGAGGTLLQMYEVQVSRAYRNHPCMAFEEGFC